MRVGGKLVVTALRSTDHFTIAEAVRLADRVFIKDRGLTGSLSERYPAAFKNSKNAKIHVVQDLDKSVISMACSRRFRVRIHGTIYAGCMIGLVCTRPDQRGEGVASAVVQSITDGFAREGGDFVVLWSGLEGFYISRGWHVRDLGLFGRLDVGRTDKPVNPSDLPSRGTLADLDVNRAMRIRRRNRPLNIRRCRSDWAAVPLPCHGVDLVNADGAYSLVGRAGDSTSVVFEAAGSRRGLEQLWGGIVSGTDTLFVNSWAGDPVADWWDSKKIEWQSQRLTHWKYLSSRCDALESSNWHIPFFDRI